MKLVLFAAIACTLLLVVNGASRMSTSHRLRSRLSTQYTSNAAQCSSGVVHDLFTGYMDEEVAATLHEIFRLQTKASDRWSQVIITERLTRHLSAPKSELFERDITKIDSHVPETDRMGYAVHFTWDKTANSGKGYWKCAKVAGKKDWCGADNGQSKNGDALNQVLGGLAQQVTQADVQQIAKNLMKQHKDGQVETQKLKTQEGNMVIGDDPLTMTVVAFRRTHQPPAPGKGAAVLMRAPEMGIQSALVFNFLDACLKAAPHGPLRLYAIGASGAAGQNAGKNECPNCMHMVLGSVFIGGVHVGASQNEFTSEIRVGDLESASEEIWAEKDASPAKKKIKHKMTNAKGKFNQDHVDPAKFEWENIKAGTDSAIKTKIKEFTQKLGRDVDTTINYFGGHATKLASIAVGSHAVNMEDYHVVRAFRDTINRRKTSPNPVCQAAIFRVDADPVTVTAEDATAVNQWMHDNPTISVDAYAATLEWKAAGMPMDNVPETMCWSFAEGKDAQFIKNIKADGQAGCVMSPLLAEVATDMKADLTEAGGAYSSWDSSWAKKATFAEQAAALCIELWKHNGGAASTEQCPTWVRGKWWSTPGFVKNDFTAADNTPVDTSQKGKKPFSNRLAFGTEGTDRFFYKASNFAGLQHLNQRLFRGRDRRGTFVLPEFVSGTRSLDDTCTC